LGLYLVYDEKFSSDKLILGNEFIDSYRALAFNYEDFKFGVSGYVTPATEPKPVPPPPGPNPTPITPPSPDSPEGQSTKGKRTLILIAIGGGVVAIIAIVCWVLKVKRRRLAEKLREMEA
jgi:hypothetical protein